MIGPKVSKARLLRAITKHRGLITVIAESLKVDDTTIYNYMKADPEIKQAVEDSREAATNYVESKLFQQIDEGNIAAIIFYLKTMGKKRGYVERIEINDRTAAEDRAKEIAEARGLNSARILSIAEDILAGRA